MSLSVNKKRSLSLRERIYITDYNVLFYDFHDKKKNSGKQYCRKMGIGKIILRNAYSRFL